MGRTIHYKITNKKTFTPQEKKTILDIQDEFNKKYTWTCEDFWLGENQFKGSKDAYGGGFRGFVKTAGNEWNSMLVVSAITLISIKLPKLIFTMQDGGEFLLFPLEIQGGKARVDMEDLMDSLKYWKTRTLDTLVDEAYLKLESIGIKFKCIWKGKMGERVVHECPSKGIRETVPEMQYEMEDVSITGNDWKPVKEFCRKVDPKDFENHPEFQTCVIDLSDMGKIINGTPNQMMAGFHGEYYGKKSVAEVALESQQTQKRLFDVVGFLVKEGLIPKDPLK